MRRDENVSIDLLLENLGSRGRRIVEVIGLVASLIFALSVTALGIAMVRFAASMGLTTAGEIDIQSAWLEIALPLSSRVNFRRPMTRLRFH
jgi:TRAP-type C4-dicarboxylate transport system permease small subunit